MIMFRSHTFVCMAVVSILSTAVSFAAPPILLWTEQLGTGNDDESNGVTTDSLGNVYITGETSGDAFLAKYDASGNFQWSEQLGGLPSDSSQGVSTDSLDNVYISGIISGDAFLAKYDPNGTLQWTEQLGTVGTDSSEGVSADSLGNVYISGFTAGSLGGPNAGGTDAFLAKYDTSGNLQWTEQFGTSGDDRGTAVSADSFGNVYITGFVDLDLTLGLLFGSGDAFLAKYDPNGTLQWTEQLGTALGITASLGVSADLLGNVYISGVTHGSLGGPNAGSGDAFLAKYDPNGTLQWTEQLGTSFSDESYGVSADSLGNVYISGTTYGSLGKPNCCSGDAFLAKYDASGNFQWVEQLGTSFSVDESHSVSADSLGNVYISGSTEGSLGGPNAGNLDAFVTKYDVSFPGDFDNNGIVDGEDFLLWQLNPSVG